MKVAVWVRFSVAMASASLGLSAAAGELGLDDIVGAATDLDCLAYRPVGTCLWIDCDLTGCRVVSSLQVSHYLPELVLSVFNHRSPWNYDGSLQRAAAATTGLRGGHPESGAGTLRFYRADAIGSPALTAVPVVAPFLCRSPVRPFKPYFISDLDIPNWRTPVLEQLHPNSILPGRRLIGRTGDIWGSLYPRHGFILHTDPRRAAAVIAQRVADLITRPRRNRVFTVVDSDCGRGCRGPAAIDERSDGHKWQLLYPERSGCGRFGRDESVLPAQSDRGDQYAWQLWRRYVCCPRRGQRLLAVLPLPGASQ